MQAKMISGCPDVLASSNKGHNNQYILSVCTFVYKNHNYEYERLMVSSPTLRNDNMGCLHRQIETSRPEFVYALNSFRLTRLLSIQYQPMEWQTTR